MGSILNKIRDQQDEADHQAATTAATETPQPSVFEILCAINAAHHALAHARACILARHPEYRGITIP